MSTTMCVVARLKQRTANFGMGTVCWVHEDHEVNAPTVRVIAARRGCALGVLDLQPSELMNVETRAYDYKSPMRWRGPHEQAIALALSLVERPLAQ